MNIECSEFDGGICMNAESYNYATHGECCVDCKDKKGVDNMKKMNKLFDELWWLSDQVEPMNDFIEAIKSYVDYMGGEVQIGVIDLYDLGFEQGFIYIAYDDCSGASSPTVSNASDFIKYYKGVVNEYPELEPQEFWIPKLEQILEL